jgi:phage terminase small subunit
MDDKDKKPKKAGRPKGSKSLTPKQKKFARNIVKGMSQVDSYRDAYNVTKDNKHTHRVKAYEVAKNGDVAAMIADLKARAEQGVVWTREMAMAALLDTYKMARDQNHAQGATGALKELNAMYGYNEATKINIGGQKDNPILVAKDEADL